MSPFLLNKRLKFFLRLDYPLHVQMNATDFVAWYPDLPEVRLSGTDLGAIYERMDGLRREWLKARLEAGEPVPMPHAGPVAEAAPREPKKRTSRFAQSA